MSEAQEVVLPWMQQIESAIVEKLKPALAPLPVEAVSEKTHLVHAFGDALVMLTGMRPKTQSRALNTSLQEITLTYEVYLRSRSLRNHTGLYPMLAASLQALVGFRPAFGQPLTMANSSSAGQDDGVWAWSLNLETDTLLAPCLEVAADGPLFKSATFGNCCDCEEEENCECQ